VEVRVAETGAFEPERVQIFFDTRGHGAGESSVVESPPYLARFTVPEYASGTVFVRAWAFSKLQGVVDAPEVVLNVEAVERLLQLVAYPPLVAARATSRVRMRVEGIFSPGTTRSLAGLPMEFRSSDPSVARVTADGEILVLREGEATISVIYQGKKATVAVRRLRGPS